MVLPSGDHRASRSWAPGLRVRLRTGPAWMGTVNTSPRATNSARSPLGERPYSSTSAAMREGRLAPPSVGTVMAMALSRPLRTSSTCRPPVIS